MRDARGLLTSWWERRLRGEYGVEAGMDSIEVPDK